MPSHSEKQSRLDFDEAEDQSSECNECRESKEPATIDFSFKKRLDKKDSLEESKIYEGILSLIKHRYP